MNNSQSQVALQDKPALTKEESKQIVWTLSLPTLIEMILISLIGMADMIQVGRVGPAAITAVGLTNQPIMLLQAIFQALNVGTTALVARFIGMGQPKDASDTLKQTFAVTIILGLVISIFAAATAPYILLFMGAEPDVIAVGTPYFRVVAAGFLFNAIAMAIGSALRGAGDTRTPMIVNLLANGINVLFNWILIWGKFGFPRLEVLGAGIATTLSRIVASILFVVIAVKGERRIKLSFQALFKLNKSILGRIYNVGFPAAIEQMIMRTGQIAFAKVISSLGTITYAAHQVGMNILSLSFMPGMAFATSATTLVGQYLGAKRPDDAERCGNTSHRIGLIVGLCMTAIFFFFGKPIALLYSDDPSVVLVSATILKIYALAQPFQSTQFVLAGGLRGAGDTRYPLYSTFVGMWVGRVFLGWLFVNVFEFGLQGAWMAMALDQIMRGILISLRFKTGKWKTAKV